MRRRSGDPGSRPTSGSGSRPAAGAESPMAGGTAGVRSGGRTGRPSRSAARAVRLCKVYGSGQMAVTALQDVDVEFPRGRFTAIMGPSGSGKSTLMHCLAGLDTVSRGRVYIGDVDLSRLSDKQLTQLRRDRVGFIFQQYNLLPTLTAAENITLPLDIAGRRPDKKWLREVVDAVGLAPRLRHRPTELSGGQQQRVACARALVTKPEIVFADEPTGNLDSRSGAEVLGFLQASVHDFGQTVVMVTHDANAASYSDEVIFLADGRIVDSLTDPTAVEVLDRMKHLDTEIDPDGYYEEEEDYDAEYYGRPSGAASADPYAYEPTGETGEFPSSAGSEPRPRSRPQPQPQPRPRPQPQPQPRRGGGGEWV